METSKTVPQSPVIQRSSIPPFTTQTSYTPIMGARTTLVNRTSMGEYPRTAAPVVNRRSQLLTAPVARTVGAVPQASSTSVNAFREHRDKEKRELGMLNDRLASYIEKTRFLEAQNNTLRTEVENLTAEKGNEVVRLKEMFAGEMGQARALIDDLTAQKADADVRNMRLEDLLEVERREHEADLQALDDLRAKYDDLEGHLRGYETEISALKSRVTTQDGDLATSRDTIKRLQNDNAKLRMDLDTETVNHINVANRVQSLEEEMAFMATVYDQEMKELKAIGQRDITGEMKDYWKGELSQAVKEIQGEYERRLEQIRLELDNTYSQQLREIRQNTKDSVDGDYTRDETKRLRAKVLDLTGKLTDMEAKNAQLGSQKRDITNQLDNKEQDYENDVTCLGEENDRLKEELDDVHAQLKDISDAKINLELELTTYRALLDEEDRRISNPETEPADAGHIQVTQSTGRVTLQRSSRGPMCFTEVPPDGRFVSVENNSTGKLAKVMNLKNWRIERMLAGSKSQIIYTFGDVELGPGESVKVWSKGAESSQKPNDLMGDFFTWGTGNSSTTLYDPESHEKASAILKFVI